MAQLDDDTLLCVFGHCNIDTFLSLRLLSRAILGLINQNLTRLCQSVASSTFPGQHEIFVSSAGKAAYDLQWLKCLRFQQLAAILVEVTNQRNNANNRLNAENPRGRTPRGSIFRAFKIVAELSRISKSVHALTEDKLPTDVEFKLPDMPAWVRRRHKWLRDGTRDPPPILGKPELAPFELSDQALVVWRRRLTVLRKQLDYFQNLRGFSLDGEQIKLLAKALFYEFNGRHNDDSSMSLHLGDTADLDTDISTAEKLLEIRSHWLWTTVTDLGPELIWQECNGSHDSENHLLNCLRELWQKENFYEKTMKCLAAKAFFIGVSRMLLNFASSCGPSSGHSHNNVVFAYGVNEISNGPLSEIDSAAGTFGHINFDFRLRSDDLRLFAQDIPKGLPGHGWYVGEHGPSW